MTYDEVLAARVRVAVERVAGAGGHESREIAMFGGLCWTVNTHMAVGVMREDLMVSVGKDGVAAAVAQGARQAVMGRRTMTGIVLVGATALQAEESLDAWVAPAVGRAVAKAPKGPKSA